MQNGSALFIDLSEPLCYAVHSPCSERTIQQSPGAGS